MKWIRFFRLVVQTDSRTSAALDLSDYRVTFEISQANVGAPCTADIKVYNVAPSTVAKIKAPTNEAIAREKFKVIIEAGYQDNHAVIFNGELWWKSTGRENETDTFMRLIASQGDRQTAFGSVQKAFPKGTSQEDILAALAKEYGEEVVEKPELLKTKLIRGKTVYKPLRQAITQLATNNGYDWGLTTDGLCFRPGKPTVSNGGKALILTSFTGLIGRPTLTVTGVQLRCLLDPRIQYGTRIMIDNTTVQRQAYDTSYSKDAWDKNLAAGNQMTDADGLYEVFARTITGDTRGQAWYCDLVALGVNSAVSSIAQQPWSNIPNAD